MTEHGHNMSEEAQTEDEFASADDFKVSRDSSGDLLPQVMDTQLGKVKVVPMAYGDVEKHFGASTVADIGPAQLADLLEEHVAAPDLSSDAGGRIDEDYVKSMKPTAPRELIFAILEASGIEADVQMQDNGGAEVSVGN